MKVLFLGDLAGTGFGTVTMGLGKALLDRNIDVRFMSLNEGDENDLEEPFRSRTALLHDRDGWLATGLLRARLDQDHYQVQAHTAEDAARLVHRIEGMFTGALFDDGWTPDTGIVLGDMGSLKISPILRLIPDSFPCFHYVPIEGVWLPPAWGLIWRKLHPVAVCKFGAEQISMVTGTETPFVYHGVDTEAFYPVSPTHPIVLRTKKGLAVLKTKEQCRRFLGWPPDEFIMYRADRHMPRKEYPALFRAIAPVLMRHPKSRLIVHAMVLDEGGDFEDDVSHFGPLSARMNCTGIGGRADRKLLCAMYNAADLYVSNCAEGFGLTIAESLACGTPALGLDYSSVPEVIGPAGEVVPSSNPIDNIYSHVWAHVDEGKFAAAIDRLMSDRRALTLLGLKGPGHVKEHFSWPKAAEQFEGLFREVVREEVAA